MTGSVASTGATGFIGWHLCEAFRHAGWRVRAVVRPGNAKPTAAGVDVVQAALESAGLARAIDGCQVLVHAAGVARARRASQFDLINVSGTRAAVDAANDTRARLVYISSQAAIGAGTIARPAREDDVPRPLTAYGRSKVAAEAAVRSGARVPWVILRPTSVYGPRDRQFLPLFRLASRGILAQAIDAATPLTLIYVDDLTRAVVLASGDDRVLAQALFLGHPDPLSAGELLQLLARTVDRRIRRLRIPRPVVGVAALAGEVSWLLGREPLVDLARYAELGAAGFVCSVDRARELLGFTATVPLEEGVLRTVRWYRQNGWI